MGKQSPIDLEKGDIISFLEEKKKEVDEVVEKYFPRKVDEKYLEKILGKPKYKYSVEAFQNSLTDPIWDFLDRGGKRWRPALFILIYEALGGKNEEMIRDLVLIPELIHNGSIIIDDVEDRGELRRGKPTLHKIYGEDVAINAGNFLYFFPLISLLKNSKYLSDKQRIKILETYNHEMLNIHLGQGTDIYWHKGKAKNISEDEYLQMCSFKTGCLSRMSAKIAAVMAGVDENTINKVGYIAEAIGIAFQIQDDILDIALKGEDREKFGKSFGNDIKEGKRTLMVIYTLQKAREADKRRLIEILDKEDNTDKEIIDAINILERYDSIEYARKRAVKIVKEAWDQAEPLLKDNRAKTLLKEFVYYLIERQV